MFRRNTQSASKSDASAQELRERIRELKGEAKRIVGRDDPDQEELGNYFKELERSYRALADAESFPGLEEKYRAKAASWRKAADEKRVVKNSPLTGDEANQETPEEQSVANDQEDARTFEFEEPPIDFDDVGGRDEIVARLRELVMEPIEEKDKYRKYEVPVPNGILFEGPPGTGKSYLTKALAGELDRQFLDVSLADIRGSLAGESEQNLQCLFEEAIAEQPCVISIDEVDAIVYDRGDTGGGAEMRQLISQFLRDMPSLSGEDVLIVGSTNLQGDMDDAATRPGRFGHRFTIDLPDEACRREILRVHLETKPVATSDVDSREIARHTEGYSSADLEALTVEASRKAAQEDKPITQRHLKHGVGEVKPSVNTSDW